MTRRCRTTCRPVRVDEANVRGHAFDSRVLASRFTTRLALRHAAGSRRQRGGCGEVTDAAHRGTPTSSGQELIGAPRPRGLRWSRPRTRDRPRALALARTAARGERQGGSRWTAQDGVVTFARLQSRLPEAAAVTASRAFCSQKDVAGPGPSRWRGCGRPSAGGCSALRSVDRPGAGPRRTIVGRVADRSTDAGPRSRRSVNMRAGLLLPPSAKSRARCGRRRRHRRAAARCVFVFSTEARSPRSAPLAGNQRLLPDGRTVAAADATSADLPPPSGTVLR